MNIKFSTVPNSKGMGVVFVDGEAYHLPAEAVGQLQENEDAVRELTQEVNRLSAENKIMFDRIRIEDLVKP